MRALHRMIVTAALLLLGSAVSFAVSVAQPPARPTGLGIGATTKFLLTVTNGLANVPAVARSITSQADCANVALGQNGLTLEKAILQLDPKFRFATNQLSLPTDWATELGTQSTALNYQDIVAIARCINSGSEGGGTATHDDQVVEIAFGLGLQSELCGQFCIRWLDED